MATLIGYPQAGFATQFPASSVYHLIAAGLRVGLTAGYADITGNQGKGTGGGKGRAVGVGLDPSDARALASAAWVDQSVTAGQRERRAAINASIQADRALADRLMALGRAAATKQGQRIMDMRGVRPSDTSLADAASDAVLSILDHVRRLDKLTAEQWAAGRVLWVLRMYAGRGAFASLASWAGAGLTGDTARHKGKANGREVHSIDQAWAASGGPSVQNLTIDLAEHRPDDQVWLPSSQAARRSVVRWVFQVGYREFKASLSDGKGKGRAAGAALSRCRVLGNVILGASLADACSVSGFSTVKAWVESCKDAGLFESLRASRVAGLADCQAVELHRVASRHWALQVNRLARALASVGGVAWADTMATDSQRAQGRRGKAAGARTLRRRAIVRDLARALDLATWHKAKARAAAADTLALFDHALDGIHSDKWGDLRVLAGLSDKLGRAVGGSKIDGAAIGKARGKVAHKAPTVGRAESIGRRASKRPCAVSVGGAGVYGMDGPAGFVLSIGRDPAASLAPWSGAFRLALVRALASARS